MRYVGWYDVYYQCDPAAENVFGRETLRQRRNPALRAWLRSGGLLSDFIQLPAQPHEARPATER